MGIVLYGTGEYYRVGSGDMLAWGKGGFCSLLILDVSEVDSI